MSKQLLTQAGQADPFDRASQRPPCFIDRFDHRALSAGFGDDAHDPLSIAHQRADRRTFDVLSSFDGLGHTGEDASRQTRPDYRTLIDSLAAISAGAVARRVPRKLSSSQARVPSTDADRVPLRALFDCASYFGGGVMLRLEQVHTHYGAIEALSGVSLEVRRGGIVTLIGSNGAGKTTLMMTVCGTPRASSGRVLFDGQDITALPTHEIMRMGLAISPEGRRVFLGLTVLENLKMGGFFASRHEIDAGLAHVYKLFPQLERRMHQRAGTMSGGEQQMLAIGRALMSRPRLLLLDEPTLGLAPLVIAQIFDIIRAIRDEGVTVFLVEQNANKALQVADRGYVLETGRVMLADTGANLLANERVKNAYLGG